MTVRAVSRPISGDEEMMRQMYSRMPDLHLTIEQYVCDSRFDISNGPKDIQ